MPGSLLSKAQPEQPQPLLAVEVAVEVVVVAEVVVEAVVVAAEAVVAEVSHQTHNADPR